MQARFSIPKCIVCRQNQILIYQYEEWDIFFCTDCNREWLPINYQTISAYVTVSRIENNNWFIETRNKGVRAYNGFPLNFAEFKELLSPSKKFNQTMKIRIMKK